MLYSNRMIDEESESVFFINERKFATVCYDGIEHFKPNAMNELAAVLFKREDRVHALLRGQTNVEDFISFEVLTGIAVDDLIKLLRDTIEANRHRFPLDFEDYIKISREV